MDAKQAIARAFLEAWCTREFARLGGWVDPDAIDALVDALPVPPREVLRADVLTVDDGLQLDFRFRVPSPTGGTRSHLIEERVLVHTDGDRVTALDLFGTRLRSRELVAS